MVDGEEFFSKGSFANDFDISRAGKSSKMNFFLEVDSGRATKSARAGTSSNHGWLQMMKSSDYQGVNDSGGERQPVTIFHKLGRRTNSGQSKTQRRPRFAVRTRSRTTQEVVSGADDQAPKTFMATLLGPRNFSMPAKVLEHSAVSQRAGMKLSGLKETDIKMPLLAPKPYGQQWEEDVFTLFGNAIRSEIGVAYEMLCALSTMLPTVDPPTIKNFFLWWRIFEPYINDVIEVFEAVIFPWLESVVPLEGSLARDMRLETNDRVRTLARKVKETETLFLSYDSNAFVALVTGVAEFTREVLAMFDDMESQVPGRLKMFFTKDNKYEVDSQVREFVSHRRSSDMFFPITFRWVAVNENRHQQLIDQHLRGHTRLMFPLWEKKAERLHFSVANRITITAFGPVERTHSLTRMFSRDKSMSRGASVANL